MTHLPLSLIRGEIKSFIVLFSWPLFVAPHLGAAHRNTDGGGGGGEVVVVVAGVWSGGGGVISRCTQERALFAVIFAS